MNSRTQSFAFSPSHRSALTYRLRVSIFVVVYLLSSIVSLAHACAATVWVPTGPNSMTFGPCTTAAHLSVPISCQSAASRCAATVQGIDFTAANLVLHLTGDVSTVAAGVEVTVQNIGLSNEVGAISVDTLFPTTGSSSLTLTNLRITSSSLVNPLAGGCGETAVCLAATSLANVVVLTVSVVTATVQGVLLPIFVRFNGDIVVPPTAVWTVNAVTVHLTSTASSTGGITGFRGAALTLSSDASLTFGNSAVTVSGTAPGFATSLLLILFTGVITMGNGASWIVANNSLKLLLTPGSDASFGLFATINTNALIVPAGASWQLTNNIIYSQPTTGTFLRAFFLFAAHSSLTFQGSLFVSKNQFFKDAATAASVATFNGVDLSVSLVTVTGAASSFLVHANTMNAVLDAGGGQAVVCWPQQFHVLSSPSVTIGGGQTTWQVTQPTSNFVGFFRVTTVLNLDRSTLFVANETVQVTTTGSGALANTAVLSLSTGWATLGAEQSLVLSGLSWTVTASISCATGAPPIAMLAFSSALDSSITIHFQGSNSFTYKPKMISAAGTCTTVAGVGFLGDASTSFPQLLVEDTSLMIESNVPSGVLFGFLLASGNTVAKIPSAIRFDAGSIVSVKHGPAGAVYGVSFHPAAASITFNSGFEFRTAVTAQITTISTVDSTIRGLALGTGSTTVTLMGTAPFLIENAVFDLSIPAYDFYSDAVGVYIGQFTSASASMTIRSSNFTVAALSVTAIVGSSFTMGDGVASPDFVIERNRMVSVETVTASNLVHTVETLFFIGVSFTTVSGSFRINDNFASVVVVNNIAKGVSGMRLSATSALQLFAPEASISGNVIRVVSASTVAATCIGIQWSTVSTGAISPAFTTTLTLAAGATFRMEDNDIELKTSNAVAGHVRAISFSIPATDNSLVSVQRNKIYLRNTPSVAPVSLTGIVIGNYLVSKTGMSTIINDNDVSVNSGAAFGGGVVFVPLHSVVSSSLTISGNVITVRCTDFNSVLSVGVLITAATSRFDVPVLLDRNNITISVASTSNSLIGVFLNSISSPTSCIFTSMFSASQNNVTLSSTAASGKHYGVYANCRVMKADVNSEVSFDGNQVDLTGTPTTSTAYGLAFRVSTTPFRHSITGGRFSMAQNSFLGLRASASNVPGTVINFAGGMDIFNKGQLLIDGVSVSSTPSGGPVAIGIVGNVAISGGGIVRVKDVVIASDAIFTGAVLSMAGLDLTRSSRLTVGPVTVNAGNLGYFVWSSAVTSTGVRYSSLIGFHGLNTVGAARIAVSAVKIPLGEISAKSSILVSGSNVKVMSSTAALLDFSGGSTAMTIASSTMHFQSNQGTHDSPSNTPFTALHSTVTLQSLNFPSSFVVFKNNRWTAGSTAPLVQTSSSLTLNPTNQNGGLVFGCNYLESTFGVYDNTVLPNSFVPAIRLIETDCGICSPNSDCFSANTVVASNTSGTCTCDCKSNAISPIYATSTGPESWAACFPPYVYDMTPSISRSRTSSATFSRTSFTVPLPKTDSVTLPRTPTASIRSTQSRSLIETPSNSGSLNRTPSMSANRSTSDTLIDSPSGSVSIRQTPTKSVNASTSDTSSVTSSTTEDASPSSSLLPSPSRSPSLSNPRSRSLSDSASQTPNRSDTASLSSTATHLHSVSPTASPSTSHTMTSRIPTPSRSLSKSVTRSGTLVSSMSVSRSATHDETGSTSETLSETTSRSRSRTWSFTRSRSTTGSTSNTHVVSASDSVSGSPTSTPSTVVTPSTSVSPSATVSPTTPVSVSISDEHSASRSSSLSVTESYSLSASTSPSGPLTATPTLLPTPSPTLSVSASVSASHSLSATTTYSLSGTATFSMTGTPSGRTASMSGVRSATASPSSKPSGTETARPSPSASPSVSASLTVGTISNAPSQSYSESLTPSNEDSSSSNSDSWTATPTLSLRLTSTNTTVPTNTDTDSFSSTPSPSDGRSATSTMVDTPSSSESPSASRSQTSETSRTTTVSDSLSASDSPTLTESGSLTESLVVTTSASVSQATDSQFMTLSQSLTLSATDTNSPVHMSVSPTLNATLTATPPRLSHTATIASVRVSQTFTAQVTASMSVTVTLSATRMRNSFTKSLRRSTAYVSRSLTLTNVLTETVRPSQSTPQVKPTSTVSASPTLSATTQHTPSHSLMVSNSNGTWTVPVTITEEPSDTNTMLHSIRPSLTSALTDSVTATLSGDPFDPLGLQQLRPSAFFQDPENCFSTVVQGGLVLVLWILVVSLWAVWVTRCGSVPPVLTHKDQSGNEEDTSNSTKKKKVPKFLRRLAKLRERLTLSDDSQDRIRLVVAFHAYTSVFYSCHPRCAVLHAVELLSHIASILTTVAVLLWLWTPSDNGRWLVVAAASAAVCSLLIRPLTSRFLVWHVLQPTAEELTVPTPRPLQSRGAAAAYYATHRSTPLGGVVDGDPNAVLQFTVEPPSPAPQPQPSWRHPNGLSLPHLGIGIFDEYDDDEDEDLAATGLVASSTKDLSGRLSTSHRTNDVSRDAFGGAAALDGLFEQDITFDDDAIDAFFAPLEDAAAGGEAANVLMMDFDIDLDDGVLDLFDDGEFELPPSQPDAFPQFGGTVTTRRDSQWFAAPAAAEDNDDALSVIIDDTDSLQQYDTLGHSMAPSTARFDDVVVVASDQAVATIVMRRSGILFHLMFAACLCVGAYFVCDILRWGKSRQCVVFPWVSALSVIVFDMTLVQSLYALLAAWRTSLVVTRDGNSRVADPTQQQQQQQHSSVASYLLRHNLTRK